MSSHQNTLGIYPKTPDQREEAYDKLRDALTFLGGFLFKSVDVIKAYGVGEPLYTALVCSFHGTLYGLGCVITTRFLPGDTKWLVLGLVTGSTILKLKR